MKPRWICGELTTSVCSACASADKPMEISFCSRECQKMVWPIHKVFCGPGQDEPILLNVFQDPLHQGFTDPEVQSVLAGIRRSEWGRVQASYPTHDCHPSSWVAVPQVSMCWPTREEKSQTSYGDPSFPALDVFTLALHRLSFVTYFIAEARTRTKRDVLFFEALKHASHALEEQAREVKRRTTEEDATPFECLAGMGEHVWWALLMAKDEDWSKKNGDEKVEAAA
ncbi:hypothetical protein JCM8547_001353 [Rhodosporidiobolus lusitaniae]